MIEFFSVTLYDFYFAMEWLVSHPASNSFAEFPVSNVIFGVGGLWEIIRFTPQGGALMMELVPL